MNKEIIKRPPDYEQYGYGLKDCYTNVWTGEDILYRFYNQGIWKENNICYDLKEINWVPDKNKKYKCWWYSTDPADPADPGEDKLLYVEEWESHSQIPKLKSEIINILWKLNDDKLLKVRNYIDKL